MANKGTIREAIDFANSQIRAYQVGEYIRIRKYDGGDDPAHDTIYRIVDIKEGSYGLFSFEAPVFLLQDIITGTTIDLVRAEKSPHGPGVGTHSAFVYPFAVYSFSKRQYEIWHHTGQGVDYYQAGSLEITKLDHVEAKAALTTALNEKERKEAQRLREEEEKRIMLQRQCQRAIDNESITSEELDSLFRKLRE